MAEAEYTWWFGTGSQPEVYMPADSREDAIELARDEAAENDHDEMTIAEARPVALSNNIFTADRVLEWFVDVNEEATDEDGELRDMNTTPEQEAELEKALADAFGAWRERHKIGRAYQLDVRSEEIIQTAATPSA